MGPEVTPAAPPADVPVPLIQGSFALFRTPDGGAVVAWRAKGSDEDKRFMIPGFIIAMAAKQSGLTPEQIIEKIQAGDTDA